MKSRVIVCGYPKSGNTWLTRLTAEILRCPVIGFWCQPFNNDESIEGIGRESEFQCFKTHHTFQQLCHTLDIYGNGSEKIIYIYRDPRSVAVSGAHYFGFEPKYPGLRGLLNNLPKGADLYGRLLHPFSYKLELMSRGIVEGTTQGAWLLEPWRRHVAGYLDKGNVLALSYEYLSADPLGAARQVSQLLAISRTDLELQEAIKSQSFIHKRSKFQEEGNGAKITFLRRGQVDSWRDELTMKSLQYIEQELGDFMVELGYSLSFKSQFREAVDS